MYTCCLSIRDGLIRAVERDRYVNLVEGIKEVVRIYVKVLEKLAIQRKFKILVHPVIPVLNETRSIVMGFNEVLRASINSSKVLHYLDFAESLLDSTGKNLNENYALDGTHLHPGYTKLLSNAVEGVVETKDLVGFK